MGTGGWRWLKILLIFAILVVIQMRLVWMQLRDFRVQSNPRTEMSMDFLDRFRAVTCLRSSPWGLAPMAPQLLSDSTPFPAESRSAAATVMTQSPGVTLLLGGFFCKGERIADQSWIKVNQWIFVASVVLSALAARILARSWTLALFAAATLMTRGSLLTGIGDFGADNYLMLAYATWFAATVHFLRSGSGVAFLVCGISLIAGAIFDPVMVVLGLALPIFLMGAWLARPNLVRPLMQQVRMRMRVMRQRAAWARQYVLASPAPQAEATDSMFWSYLAAARRFVGLEAPGGVEPISWRRRYDRGGLFKPAEVPFLIWALPDRTGRLRWRPLWLAGGALLLVLVSAAGGLLAYRWLAGEAGYPLRSTALNLWANGVPFEGWDQRWYFEVFTAFDIHLLVSLGVTLWAATQSPAHGLTGYFEAVWVFLISLVLIIGAALVLDLFDARMLSGAFPWLGSGKLFSHRQVLVWVQPVLLMMGVTGAYNMLKVIDTRVKVKR